MKKCKQLFSSRLAIPTQKKATHTAGMMSVECVAIFWVVNASSDEKVVYSFRYRLGPGQVGIEVFHIVLRACEIRSQCVSLAPPRAPLKPSLLHSIVFHMLLKVGIVTRVS